MIEETEEVEDKEADVEGSADSAEAVEAGADDVDDLDDLDDLDAVEEPLFMEGNFKHAIVRLPSPTLAKGISKGGFGVADYALFVQQHLSYTAVLRSLGLKIIKLPSLPEYPDAVFVEDVAVLTPEIAVITRPGAESRRGETEQIRAVLEDYFTVAEIEEPGTLDGGDVLQVEQIIFVGLSKRTNEEGARQLAQILEPSGYEVRTIPVKKSLHLKSDVSYIGRNTLLITEVWANHKAFKKYEKIVVPADDAYAANTLLVKNRLLTPEGFPETSAKLREAGFEILEIVVTEPRKLDGGLSCMSLRF